MKWIAFIVTLVIIGSLVGCTVFDERARGIADAQRRLKKGELVSKGPNGKYFDGFGEYSRILRDEHGLMLEGSLGETKEYVQGFQSIMEPEIDRRFDRKFFDDIRVQAREKNDTNTP